MRTASQERHGGKRSERRSLRLVLALVAVSLAGVAVVSGGAGPASAVVDIGNLGPEDVPVCPGGVYPEPLFTPNCRIAATSGPITSASHDLVDGQTFQVTTSGVDAVPCFRAPASASVCSSARLQNIRFYNPNAPVTARSGSSTNPWEHIALDFSPTTHGFSDCLDGCTGTARYFSIDNNLPGDCKGKPAAECTLPQVFFGPVLMIVQWDVMILPVSGGGVVQRWTWEEVFRISSGIQTPTQNQPPHASFTWRVSDDDRLTLTFDGSGSTDDNAVVAYDWTIEGQHATGATPPAHTFPGPGTYPVTLTVEDAAGLTDSVTLDVKVVTGLVVNSVADTEEPSGDRGDGACDTGGTVLRNGTGEAECTLRAAITEANATTGPDTIRFDIPGGPATIVPTSDLPAVGGRVRIDGSTQPGGDVTLASPRSGEGTGLTLEGEDDTVQGLRITGFRTGIDALGSGHTISGNTIRAAVGVNVAASAHDVTVGGPTSQLGTAPGNRIEAGLPGLVTIGILVSGSDSTVSGNVVAPTSGAAPGVGIAVRDGASGTTVGGILDGAGNRVTEFTGDGAATGLGIDVDGTHATTVRHNVVGVAADGRTAAPNSIGIRVRASDGTVIADNVASGNVGLGISVSDPTAVVRGNRIGTDASGTSAIPNGVGGLLVIAAATIGGESTGSTCGSPCNLISGNAGYGALLGTEAATTFRGNVVGAADGDLDGTTPLPNTEGVVVNGRATIGGAASGDGNLIAFNRGTGVRVFGASSRVVIRGNRIHSNGMLGIDLSDGDADGVTPNDPLGNRTGPNSLQTFPVIQSVTPSGDRQQVAGTTIGGLSSLTVELFLNRACDDPTGYGEGELPVGVTTSSALSGAFSLLIDRPDGYRYLTATATGVDGTSEFSQCFDLLTGAAAGSTGLTSSVRAGATVLEVGSTDGFLGKVVRVGSGATAELNYVGAIASLHLARPLRFAHAAGEPVAALDDTLFVSVDKAVITRAPKLPDLAVLSGRVQAVQGRSVACGEDVTLTLGGAAVAQKVPGTKFARQSGKRCVFVAKTENGIGRFELDLGKGTWNAQVIRRDLERLTSPLEVGVKIGDDAGVESLRLRAVGAIWTYAR